ncbi:hypothetical protein BC831DRAFT_449476, partial [Entophlyctis helioformis]
MPRTSELPMRVLRHPLRPRSAITRSTRCSFSALDMDAGRRSMAEYVSVSSTERFVNMTSSCSTYAHCRRQLDLSRGLPSTRISPVSVPGPMRPARVLRKVDLPAPDPPMMAITSPARTWPVTLVSSALS